MVQTATKFNIVKKKKSNQKKRFTLSLAYENLKWKQTNCSKYREMSKTSQIFFKFTSIGFHLIVERV